MELRSTRLLYFTLVTPIIIRGLKTCLTRGQSRRRSASRYNKKLTIFFSSSFPGQSPEAIMYVLPIVLIFSMQLNFGLRRSCNIRNVKFDVYYCSIDKLRSNTIGTQVLLAYFALAKKYFLQPSQFNLAMKSRRSSDEIDILRH